LGLRGLFNGFWFVRVVLVLWLVSSCFVVLFLLRIDDIVHRELYDFGLQFSYVWAGPYWMFLRLAFVVLFVPGFLSGVALVFGVFGRGDGREVKVVKREVEKVVEKPAEVKPEVVKESANHLLATCPKCKKVFSKPLVMLDFSGGKTKLVNVCPYCSFILGSADEGVEVGVADLQEGEADRVRE
jgi:uncharacterized Zn-finger protein